MRRTGSYAAALAMLGALLILPIGSAALVGHSTSAGYVRPSVLGPCTVGTGPYRPAYDPVHHYVYVPNQAAGTITVLKGTCTLVGTITLPSGASPIDMAFDPQNNMVYATDDSLNAVYVISGTTVTSTITSSLLPSPWAILYDPGDNLMLVSNSYGSYSVVGIYGTTVYGQVGVGSFPIAMCYDPYFNVILVVNYWSQNVTLLNAYSPLGSAIGSAGTGPNPTSCAYDFANSYDYVVNSGGNNVTVLSGSGGHVGDVAVGFTPRPVAYDPARLAVFVGNTAKGSVSVIQGLTVVQLIKGVGKAAEGFCYDEQNDAMYMTAYFAAKAYIST